QPECRRSLCRGVSQKFADGRASDLVIVTSKFVHVHADELAGELRVQVACICERLSDSFVPVCETIVDAFANISVRSRRTGGGISLRTTFPPSGNGKPVWRFHHSPRSTIFSKPARAYVSCPS